MLTINDLLVHRNFFTLNWLYIKAAVLWIESGGPDNSSWKTRPMQIGNPGDPAYQVLKSGKEGANKIMDATLFNELKAGDINEPTLNIKSGIAYLFTRMVKFEQKSIVDEKDMRIYEHKLVKGETFTSLAKEKGTTIEELKNRNPTLTPTLIKPGQTLKYRKAKMDIVIAGWRTFSLSEIAQRYNVGDPDYNEKLTYLLNEVFPKLKKDKVKN